MLDAVNRPEIKRGIEIFHWSDIGSWLLVHTLDKWNGGGGEKPTKEERTGYILLYYAMTRKPSWSTRMNLQIYRANL